MRCGFETSAVGRAFHHGLLIGAALALGACSMLHRGSSATAAAAAPSADAGAQAEGVPGESAPPAPSATVHISYAHPSDYLASLSVSKFHGAEILETKALDPRHSESTVRFDGGVTVWQIKAGAGVLSALPGLSMRKRYALHAVTYGKMPSHFEQLLPDGTSPEPLEPDRYYVFTATRASGSSSYEAVRVEADGTLDGYEAEPRAGTSYALCCNVSPDFAAPPASQPSLPDSGP